MRKTVHKWFWVWDFDEEEKWLNEMAAKGLALVGVGWCRYEFEDCLPGEYAVCLEFFENRCNTVENTKYIELKQKKRKKKERKKKRKKERKKERKF